LLFLLGDGVEWCFWALLPENGMAPVCQDMEATASAGSLVQGKESGGGLAGWRMPPATPCRMGKAALRA
jgi:hypothetical protein